MNANAKLIEAVKDGDLAKAEDALKRGAQVNKIYNVGEERVYGRVRNIYKTPLMVAASNGDIAMMQKLREYGADVHKQGFYTETAIGHAMKAGQVEAVKVLHEMGAKPSYMEIIDTKVLRDIGQKSGEILDLVGETIRN